MRWRRSVPASWRGSSDAATRPGAESSGRRQRRNRKKKKPGEAGGGRLYILTAFGSLCVRVHRGVGATFLWYDSVCVVRLDYVIGAHCMGDSFTPISLSPDWVTTEEERLVLPTWFSYSHAYCSHVGAHQGEMAPIPRVV